jgi:hypothetical protein
VSAERAEPTPAAFYARRGGAWADWWTVLHPPYTLWHLSYVAIGAAIAPELDWSRLAQTVLAFFLAVGVAAHALDEWQGRPLNTAISAQSLVVVAAISLLLAVGIGVQAVHQTGWLLVPCIIAGVLIVLGYNLELFGGRLHTDIGFALGWGAFPVVVGYLAQRPPLTERASTTVLAAAAFAVALSLAQRRLSTAARSIRRQALEISGAMRMRDGGVHSLDRPRLLAPLEGALRALCWAVPLLSIALLATHLH